VWVGQPRKGAQGWVKSEAGPPGIKRPRRRRGRQAPRPPPRVAAAAQQTCPSSCAGKGTADAGARAESVPRVGTAAAVPMPRQARAACRACARDGLGALLLCSRPVRPGLHERQTLDGGPRRRGSRAPASARAESPVATRRRKQPPPRHHAAAEGVRKERWRG